MLGYITYLNGPYSANLIHGEKSDEEAVKLKQKDVERFKKLLNARLEELLGQADATVLDMTDAGEAFPDPTDRASMESDRSFTLRIRDRDRKLISKIREALQRIEDGEFGTCESCGEDIDKKRIEARPVTTLCIDCKTSQEISEKARGV